MAHPYDGKIRWWLNHRENRTRILNFNKKNISLNQQSMLIPLSKSENSC